MIFKKKKSLSIHKVDMNESFKIQDMTFIPIHELTYEGEKNFMFGHAEPLGIIKVENHEVTFLSINENLSLEELKKDIPDLNEKIESVIKN